VYVSFFDTIVSWVEVLSDERVSLCVQQHAWMEPRFLLCRADVSVQILKKFVRLKFDLTPQTCVRTAWIITSHVDIITSLHVLILMMRT